MHFIFNLQTVSTDVVAAAPPRTGLTLLVTEEKSPNRPKRPHPSQRQRRRMNHRWSSLMIQRSPSHKKSLMTHHSHKLLNIAVERGLKSGRLYWRRRHCRHHLSTAPPNLDPKNRKMEPSLWRGRDPPCLHGPKTKGAGQIAGGVIRLQRIHNFWCSMLVFTPFA
jgi:hypothetical protein